MDVCHYQVNWPLDEHESEAEVGHKTRVWGPPPHLD